MYKNLKHIYLFQDFLLFHFWQRNATFHISCFFLYTDVTTKKINRKEKNKREKKCEILKTKYNFCNFNRETILKKDLNKKRT